MTPACWKRYGQTTMYRWRETHFPEGPTFLLHSLLGQLEVRKPFSVHQEKLPCSSESPPYGSNFCDYSWWKPESSFCLSRPPSKYQPEPSQHSVKHQLCFIPYQQGGERTVSNHTQSIWDAGIPEEWSFLSPGFWGWSEVKCSSVAWQFS